MWESRVLQRAFERLELHEGELSRAVLRGGGGGDVTSLPDPGWGTTQVYPARISLKTNRHQISLKRRTDTGFPPEKTNRHRISSDTGFPRSRSRGGGRSRGTAGLACFGARHLGA